MWHSARITGTAPSQPCPAGRDALAPRVSRRRPARAEEEEEAVEASTTAASPPPPPRSSVHHAGTTTAAASLPRAGRRLPKPASPRVPPPRPATGRPGSAPQGLTGPPPPPTRRTHLRCRPRPRPRRISRPWRCPPHRPARLPPRRGSGPALASPGRTPPRSAPPRPAPLHRWAPPPTAPCEAEGWRRRRAGARRVRGTTPRGDRPARGRGAAGANKAPAEGPLTLQVMADPSHRPRSPTAAAMHVAVFSPTPHRVWGESVPLVEGRSSGRLDALRSLKAMERLASASTPSVVFPGLTEGTCGCQGWWYRLLEDHLVLSLRAPQNEQHLVPATVCAVQQWHVSMLLQIGLHTESGLLRHLLPLQGTHLRGKGLDHPEATVSSNSPEAFGLVPGTPSRIFRLLGFCFTMRVAPGELALGMVEACKHVLSGVSVQITSISHVGHT